MCAWDNASTEITVTHTIKILHKSDYNDYNLIKIYLQIHAYIKWQKCQQGKKQSTVS